MSKLLNKPDKSSPDDDRMNQVIQNRLKSNYGGTSAKLKYNAGLKSKHKMTRNPNALPGWRDLETRYKGAFIGAGLGAAAAALIYTALRRTEFVANLPGGELLLLCICVLLLVMLTGAGFVLGKTSE
jgi:hypothetical protein